MALKTPLYDMHIKYGGKMVEFTGYELPVQYSSIILEHKAVRQNVGIFDVSHMGEILVTGEDALKTLNYLMTNDFSNMNIGQVRYSLMLNPDGTAIDDILVYKSDNEAYMVVVNACNKDKDYEWMLTNKISNTTVTNISDHIAQIALQGPNAEDVMSELIDINLLSKKYYTFVKDVEINGCICIISRTGYTGERGFEIYVNNEDAVNLWETIMASGKVTPCGLGARDTLRLEAAMPLYGHEISDSIMSNEVGFAFAIKMDKDFIGRDALHNHTPMYKRIGVVLLDKGIAREGAKVYKGDREIGYVTSGTHSPLTGKAIAMARVLIDYDDYELIVDVRGRKLKAEVVSLPFNKS